jgi:hypothetical protein
VSHSGSTPAEAKYFSHVTIGKIEKDCCWQKNSPAEPRSQDLQHPFRVSISQRTLRVQKESVRPQRSLEIQANMEH